MESPIPQTTGFKSYISRARGLMRDFNSLPWIARGPLTVEYDAANARSTPRPLAVWEKNPHMNHLVQRTQEVDLTAGESTPTSGRHTPSSVHRNPAMVSPTYVNEHGQEWPATVPAYLDFMSPSSEEGGSATFSNEDRRVASPYPRNMRATPSPPEVEPVTAHPPHANGVLLPATPPLPRFSPEATWTDPALSADVPPPTWLNYQTPSPVPTPLPTMEQSASLSRTGNVQSDTIPLTDVPTRPPSSQVRQSTPSVISGSPFLSPHPLSSTRPSTPSSNSVNPEATRPSTGRRTLLRRPMAPPLVAPNPRSNVGQTPRWLSNLIPGRRTPIARGQSEGSERPDSRMSQRSGLHSSWVEIRNSNAGSSDSDSDSDSDSESDEEDIAGTVSQEDMDAQIARAMELEADGVPVSNISTLPVPPVLLSPSTVPLQRAREDAALFSSNPPLEARHRINPPSQNSRDVLRPSTPSDVPVILASSTRLHNDPTGTSPHLSSYHPYSGYVSTQPPVSGTYGQAYHTGHDGYVPSTTTTTRIHSRSASGRTSRSGGEATNEVRDGDGTAASGGGGRRIWPPPDPIHAGGYYPAYSYPAYPGPPIYQYGYPYTRPPR
ncbi:hypothetical protein V5O48_000353 [Marasmius crinis-equi]|uniref:Uncharacterized protein n=1 Tax=Marasmius crinis-equi TaxID=585013 RepID=A0ABR3G1H2_9AGAR